MKKSAVTSAVLFLLILLMVPIPVLATVTVESTINQDISVTLDFSGIDSQTYAKIRTNTQFNETTIPQIIMQNSAQRNLMRVRWGYAPIDYDDTTCSVHVTFHLGGLDIISFTVDKTSMVRKYQVSTDWRKFRVDLADGFSVDFSQYFNTPVSEWRETNRTDTLGVHPTYYYEHSGQDSLQASFYFILPTTAKNVQRAEDTITYETPPYAEDVFLNSPFPVLAAVMAISMLIVAYRKIKA